MFAVVAHEQARADEVARRFAAEGDAVETVWFRDTEQLRTQAGEQKARFEVVILFSDVKEQRTPENEAEADNLRLWLDGTPLIEAA